AVAPVRQRLADLARGRPVTNTGPSSDLDFEYEDWMADVARARVALLARAEAAVEAPAAVLRFPALSPDPPPQLARAPELTLAAETGGSLFAELGKALAATGDVRYHEVSDVPGGRLFLLIDPSGVRAAWEGALEQAPYVARV